MSTPLYYGDIFALGCEALVNPVNCVGVAGKGLAREFKQRFPDNFAAYYKACWSGDLVPGRVFVFDRGETVDHRYIINFPTKRHWREKSRLEDIFSGVSDLRQVIIHYGIRSIRVPAVGCGLGQLDWSIVRPVLQSRLSGLAGVDVRILEPFT